MNIQVGYSCFWISEYTDADPLVLDPINLDVKQVTENVAMTWLYFIFSWENLNLSYNTLITRLQNCIYCSIILFVVTDQLLRSNTGIECHDRFTIAHSLTLQRAMTLIFWLTFPQQFIHETLINLWVDLHINHLQTKDLLQIHEHCVKLRFYFLCQGADYQVIHVISKPSGKLLI